jgi:hypothetical protein
MITAATAGVAAAHPSENDTMTVLNPGFGRLGMACSFFYVSSRCVQACSRFEVSGNRAFVLPDVSSGEPELRQIIGALWGV